MHLRCRLFPILAPQVKNYLSYFEVHGFHHSLLYLLANARIRLFCFKPLENGITRGYCHFLEQVRSFGKQLDLFARERAEGGDDFLFRQGDALEEIDVVGVPAHEQLRMF